MKIGDKLGSVVLHLPNSMGVVTTAMLDKRWKLEIKILHKDTITAPAPPYCRQIKIYQDILNQVRITGRWQVIFLPQFLRNQASD